MSTPSQQRPVRGALLVFLLALCACAEPDRNYLRGSLPAAFSLEFDTVEVRRESQTSRVRIAYEREVSWPDIQWSGVNYVLELLVTRLPAPQELAAWMDVTENQEVLRQVTVRREGGYPEDEGLCLPRVSAVQVRFDSLSGDRIAGELQIHFADRHVLLGGFSALTGGGASD